jgi:hypothetical protein
MLNRELLPYYARAGATHVAAGGRPGTAELIQTFVGAHPDQFEKITTVSGYDIYRLQRLPAAH